MGQKLVHKILRIKGMTCGNCEDRIEIQLKKLEGIVKVKANYSTSEVAITYDASSVQLDAIIRTIERIDYKVKDKLGNLPVTHLLGTGIIIFAIYMIIKNTIGFNFIPSINQNMGYGILFVIGLSTSLHCIAMCGGINMTQCVSYKNPEGEKSKITKLKPSIMYNTGRVMSYTIIGGIVGALGSVVSFSGGSKGIVAVLAGTIMIIMGLNMLNIFPWLRNLNLRMPKKFGKIIQNNNGKHGPFYVGLLNGLMPCGPLQTMQIYALGTGSFIAGAMSMFMFSLGTVPLMFGFGAMSTLLTGKFTNRMMKASAILVIILGLVMANRGLSLSGINLAYGVAAEPNYGSIATIEGDVQIVINHLSNGYSPIVVQKGIPVRWNIIADAQNINGCNETLIVPQYNIQEKLEPGDNIIEFIPDKDGNIPYSCWMGMIRSNIEVVSDITKVK